MKENLSAEEKTHKFSNTKIHLTINRRMQDMADTAA